MLHVLLCMCIVVAWHVHVRMSMPSMCITCMCMCKRLCKCYMREQALTAPTQQLLRHEHSTRQGTFGESNLSEYRGGPALPRIKCFSRLPCASLRSHDVRLSARGCALRFAPPASLLGGLFESLAQRRASLRSRETSVCRPVPTHSPCPLQASLACTSPWAALGWPSTAPSKSSRQAR